MLVTSALLLDGLVSEVAVVVEPDRELTVIEHDPADNRVLEAAVAAQADCIVSGDADLLEIVSFEGVRIVSPREFIAGESR
jgi:putative PIN family toxin of toxin-antitoxin system